MRPKTLPESKKRDELHNLIPDNRELLNFAICFPEPFDHLEEIKEVYDVQDIKDFPLLLLKAGINLNDRRHCTYLQDPVKMIYQANHNGFKTQFDGIFSDAGITIDNKSNIINYLDQYPFPDQLIYVLQKDKVSARNIKQILKGLYKKVSYWYLNKHEYTEYVKKPLKSQQAPPEIFERRRAKLNKLIPNDQGLIDFAIYFPKPVKNLKALKKAYYVEDMRDFPFYLQRAGIDLNDFGDCLYIQNAVDNCMYNNQQNNCNRFTTQINLVFAKAGITDINTITAYIQLYAFPDKLISTLHEDKIPVGNIKQVVKGLSQYTPFWYFKTDAFINYVKKPLESQ